MATEVEPDTGVDVAVAAAQFAAATLDPSKRKLPRRVLLAASGSVATIKLPELARLIVASGSELRIVLTAAARRFVKLEDLPPGVPVYGDEDEWRKWEKVGDEVLHIELRRWADVLVIAPLSANTLAKIANGLCDNLLTCIMRAWDFKEKWVVLAPAMNTYMWNSPVTDRHLIVLEAYQSITVVWPVSKKLACGDVGEGAMASVQKIFRVLGGSDPDSDSD